MTELLWAIVSAPLAVLGLIFIPFPFAALLPAALFAWFFQRYRSFMSLAAAFLWLVYSGYEYAMLKRVLCTGECNIRLDLFIIYPLLLLFSLAAAVSASLGRRRQKLQKP